MQKWEWLSLSLRRVMHKLVHDTSSCLEQVLATVSSVVERYCTTVKISNSIFFALCVCVCVFCPFP